MELLASTLNLTKKKIIPYIDLEYSTEMALGRLLGSARFKTKENI